MYGKCVFFHLACLRSLLCVKEEVCVHVTRYPTRTPALTRTTTHSTLIYNMQKQASREEFLRGPCIIITTHNLCIHVTLWLLHVQLARTNSELVLKTAKRKSPISGSGLWPLLSCSCWDGGLRAAEAGESHLTCWYGKISLFYTDWVLDVSLIKRRPEECRCVIHHYFGAVPSYILSETFALCTLTCFTDVTPAALKITQNSTLLFFGLTEALIIICSIW